MATLISREALLRALKIVQPPKRPHRSQDTPRTSLVVRGGVVSLVTHWPSTGTIVQTELATTTDADCACSLDVTTVGRWLTPQLTTEIEAHMAPGECELQSCFESLRFAGNDHLAPPHPDTTTLRAVVSCRGLRRAIQRTLFAVGGETDRYALGGILVEATPERITLVATDSRRLAVAHVACLGYSRFAPGHRPIVPSKAMALIERSTHDDAQEVHLEFGPADVLLRSGPTTIYARLVEGRFPQYQDVIPRECPTTFSVQVGPLLDALRSAAACMDDEQPAAHLSLTAGALEIRSEATEKGTARSSIVVDQTGPDCVLSADAEHAVRSGLINHDGAACCAFLRSF